MMHEADNDTITGEIPKQNYLGGMALGGHPLPGVYARPVDQYYINWEN